MNFKRAIGIGILLYIGSFATGIITAIILGVDLNTAESAPTNVWIIGLILGVVLTLLFSWWYFANKKIVTGAKEGAYLGLAFVGVAFALEMALIVPYIVFSEAPQDILAYYTNPFFWLTIAMIIATATAVGHWKSQK